MRLDPHRVGLRRIGSPGVEDRHTPGLYLEMTEAAARRVHGRRVPEVLGTAGRRAGHLVAQRAPRPRRPPARAARVRPSRASTRSPTSSTPRTRPPASPATTFAGTAGPARACSPAGPTIGLSLVLISPKEPERAQELRDWADFVHIRHIAEAAVPGYAMITPYENVTGGDPRFMHFYEMDTDDPERAFKSMTPLVMDRIGGTDTEAFRHWAFGPSLRIMYVNSFARVGERLP